MGFALDRLGSGWCADLFRIGLTDPAAWAGHRLLRELVCDIKLEWTPSSRVHYPSAVAHELGDQAGRF